jgi:hypothetical protein
VFFVAGLLSFFPIYALTEQESKVSDTPTEQVANEQQATPEQTFGEKAGDFFSDLLQLLIFLLVCLIPIGMIFHMAYVNWETKQLDKILTIDAFVEKRRKKGLSETMSDDEKEQADQFLSDAFAQLTAIEAQEDGSELRKPKKMRELLRCQKLVKKAIQLLPTDEAIVVRINELNEFLYNNLRRSFFASWKLIIISSIVMVISTIVTWNSANIAGSIVLSFVFLSPVVIYYLSGNVPQYMIDKKNARGSGGGWFTNILIGMGVGILFSGQTVVTKTKWSDGSSTTNTDNSGHLIALFLGFIVLAIIAFTIIFWAIINYLRNYVLYF